MGATREVNRAAVRVERPTSEVTAAALEVELSLGHTDFATTLVSDEAADLALSDCGMMEKTAVSKFTCALCGTDFRRTDDVPSAGVIDGTRGSVIGHGIDLDDAS